MPECHVLIRSEMQRPLPFTGTQIYAPYLASSTLNVLFGKNIYPLELSLSPHAADAHAFARGRTAWDRAVQAARPAL